MQLLLSSALGLLAAVSVPFRFAQNLLDRHAEQASEQYHPGFVIARHSDHQLHGQSLILRGP